jgi:hypothetical protein
LFLFNQSYEIHLHTLAMQDRGDVLQFKELLNKLESLKYRSPAGDSSRLKDPVSGLECAGHPAWGFKSKRPIPNYRSLTFTPTHARRGWPFS